MTSTMNQIFEEYSINLPWHIKTRSTEKVVKIMRPVFNKFRLYQCVARSIPEDVCLSRSSINRLLESDDYNHIVLFSVRMGSAIVVLYYRTLLSMNSKVMRSFCPRVIFGAQ